MSAAPLDRWKLVGVVSTAVIVLSVPAWVIRKSGAEVRQSGTAVATFVGRDACRPCHEAAFESWLGSDHDLAMDVATADTVLGDFDGAVFESKGITTTFFMRDGRFFVNTEGPDGELADFEIPHTFGHEPLQQYLVPFPGGRLQCLSIAWDTDQGEWFDLNPNQIIPPDDWLHWTRSAQNWNGMCAECHSTNLQKNFDAASNSYKTTWSEIDVSSAPRATRGARSLVTGTTPLRRCSTVICHRSSRRASTTQTDKSWTRSMSGDRLLNPRCTPTTSDARTATTPTA